MDSFHILSRRDDPSRITEVPGEKIFFVQLADAPDLGMDVLPWSRHHRVFPGEGSFDTVAFMAYLTEAGYSGPLSLEIFNDVFRETAPTSPPLMACAHFAGSSKALAGTLQKIALSGTS